MIGVRGFVTVKTIRLLTVLAHTAQVVAPVGAPQQRLLVRAVPGQVEAVVQAQLLGAILLTQVQLPIQQT
ncbi:hypothetical protein A2803_01235 [Candidatus Woesebacteria bacterium RIFCSPHIGHO2_01_FULL_44_21]|uniref:Uncharacterized protein n=1 Tax=Candidatus Woesebacteria bacterium RIFCSPHIGHO2_01_FULL_44_21 TaxID=1802503 RepID=A0A1F7Z1S3_9BACT|nr:MAG: hypothetical protein A2803_01235 [Candidatus Woesebacteria bacterium RIFCSPHIGHO2_01_FULL_44_21]OGM70815.1 MAG: hypothetical protein A2897_05225 [Candidatus Woesebacteria bacterium RIFCSPLOWO2_01_FULL_44_24b]